MVEAWFFYIFGAVVIWGINAIIDKIVLTKYLGSFSYLLMYAPPKLVSLILILFFVPVNFNSFSFYLAFVAGMLAVLGYYTYAFAMKREEASRIYLLANIYPALTAVLAAIFLNEIFSTRSYIGIFLLIIGGILISYRKGKLHKLIPFVVIIMALSTNMFYAVEQTMSKFSLNSLPFWEFFVGYLMGYLFMLFPSIVVPSFRKTFVKEIKNLKINMVLLVEFSGAFWLLGIIFFLYSTSLAPVTLVSTLSIITPFIVLLCTIFITKFWPKILKEEINLKTISLKIIATILIFVGTYLIII